MDALVARYVNPADDVFASDEGSPYTDLLLSKPSFDHKFAIPPIAQVLYLIISNALRTTH